MSRTGHRLPLLALALALATVTTSPTLAQRYDVDTYNEGDGLASSTVYGMVQDPAGRMWFATRAAISVYDGREWSTFTHADGLAVADWILLDVDASGTVWVASREHEIGRFDGKSWFSHAGPALPRECSLRDFVAFDAVGGEIRLALGTACGVALWNGSRWLHVGEDAGLPDDDVTSLELAGDSLFVGTEGGLAAIDRSSARVTPLGFEVPPGAVPGLAKDADGLWVVGDTWLGRIRDGRLDVSVEKMHVVAGDEARAAAADGEGGLIFGNSPALYHYHSRSGLRLLSQANGLIAGGANEIYRDRENNVWVSTGRGVSKIVGFRFATFLKEHGLYDDEVTAVLERRNGSFVLGHWGALSLVDGPEMREVWHVRFPVSYLEESGLNRVLELAEDDDATVWVAGNHLGLGRLRGDRVEWLSSVPPPVTSVLADANGRVWAAAGAHVFVREGSRFVRASPEAGFARGVRRMYQGPDGSIWALSSGSGALRLVDGQWEAWIDPVNPGANDIFAAYSHDGELWLGTAKGLCTAADGRIEPSRPPGPVIERPVYFAVKDSRDRVWLGTDNGVFRWNGSELDHFTVEDGLGGRETNRAAGILDSEGRVWIGTTHGITTYLEDFDRRVPVAPVVTLLRLEASGDPEPLDETVDLEPHRNDLVFSFSAISFYDEQAIRIRTWLEGHEPGWSEARPLPGRTLRYANLPPGRYRLHLEATGAAGLRSEVASSRWIVIAPPFYGRTWFWTLVVVAGVLALYAAQRYLYQHRYARQLETEVQQRIAELRRAEEELIKAQRLESLGLLAGGIAHDFNNLLMVILGNLSLLANRHEGEPRRWIADAEAAIERARQLTAQLLTFSRGGSPVRSAARIEVVVRESVNFVLRGSNARGVIDLPADLRVVAIDTGQISQLLNNLLLNAVQAMPDGGTVHIAGRNVDELPAHSRAEPGSYVEITVRDEGTGIPDHNLQRVFDPYFTTKEAGSGLGLTTAYSIARRHGGDLTVESRLGHGSTFTLYLPKSESGADRREREPGQSGNLEGVHVLVMDDDESVREVVVAMLEQLGCTVTEAADGEAALRAYVRARAVGQPCDAVIVDLTVPGGMGGEEMQRHLLQIDPGARVIVASGYAMAPIMADYHDLGFRAVLQKPFRLVEIAETLRKVLDLHARP